VPVLEPKGREKRRSALSPYQSIALTGLFLIEGDDNPVDLALIPPQRALLIATCDSFVFLSAY
jgi:hypothetical protein